VGKVENPKQKTPIDKLSQKYVVTEQIELVKESKIRKNATRYGEIWLHECGRCGHLWTSQVESPATCAQRDCRSPYWNKPRVRNT
jgi:hypothetical protein